MIKVIGRGWGVGYLVDADIPFDQLLQGGQIDDAVRVSREEGLVSCPLCWENIAEYSRYKGKWG